MKPRGPSAGIGPGVWAGFAVLLAMCVPWYFPAGGAIEPRVWAFPFWGAVTAGFYVLLALYTAFVYLFVWRDPPRRGRR